MKAVRIHEYGGPEVLKYEDAPRPQVMEGDVLVRVHAAGVNPVDSKVRAGMVHIHKLPLILGWDLSGVVHELGRGATPWHSGDEVFARPDLARDGSYAEFIAVRSKELARKPESLDHVHAAAVPLAALTAWQALFEAPAPYTSAGLQPGQTVLIHGAAGGVGHFAVQLAKWRGARVIGTASERNVQFLRELGADEAIDYTQLRFEEAVRGVDVVLDPIGGETQHRSWKVLKPGGTLVSIISRPSLEEAKAHGARGAYVFVQPDAVQLWEIAKLIDAGKLKPVVSEVLPLPQARAAHERIQTGHVRGKLVLSVA